jgi:psp operon transcriptional activator
VDRAVSRWEDPERPIDAVQFDPFASPWAPGQAQAAAPAAAVPEAPTPEAPAAGPAMPTASTADFRAAVHSYERTLLEDALRANRYNQRATAAALSLSYDQLRHALKRHKLLEGEAA